MALFTITCQVSTSTNSFKALLMPEWPMKLKSSLTRQINPNVILAGARIAPVICTVGHIDTKEEIHD